MNLVIPFLGDATKPETDENPLYETAELARKEGREAEARDLFQKALEAHPGHVDSRLGYQDLLRAGFPVLVFLTVSTKQGEDRHASVITGFDDSVGLFFLEDPSWSATRDRVPYGMLRGNPAVLVAPPAKLAEYVSRLPDTQFWRQFHRITRPRPDFSPTSAAKELEKLTASMPNCHFLFYLLSSRGELFGDQAMARCASSGEAFRRARSGQSLSSYLPGGGLW